jgi:Protein of unknown function (DUF1592)/Protein of unknown function (DUF1588)/Protein of unknown function (DUF1587)/Protein of unknown function (DUF1595)/Protein of unknown function (DUF1585)
MKYTHRALRFPAWFLTGALATAGCVGQVDSGRPHPIAGSGSGGSSSGTGAVSGTGSVTGTGLTGGAGSVAGTGSVTGTGSITATGTGGAGAGGTGVVVGPLAPRDPGRVTMRQLNRVEYNNTVRDLLGTSLQPAASFLNDAPEFGFDNNADMLSVSPVQADLYQKAAEALAAEAMTPARRATLATCDLATGDVCLRSIITTFGARAFRRVLTAAEVTSYLTLMTTARTAGATADEALRTAVEAFLISPHFLHRVEIDATPTSLVAHAVSPYEMASRLSYLVYRSMPDKPLFDAAAAGKLGAVADVQAQLTRMLADPKGSTFAPDFSTQWLGARSLELAQFDKTVFPNFTPALAASMKSELTTFFDDFIRENLPVNQLLTANFSYLDDNLATLYGVPAVGAGGLKRTTFSTSQRGGGLLTMAGPLAVTSYPTRTSLVKRGAWVLSQLLCSEPPAPPVDVPPFPQGMVMGTQRQILEMHRSNPSCSVCHVVMDNLGIALENYDAIGAWRTMEGGAAIDAKGMLPNGGASFSGGPAMAAVVAADPRFSGCVGRKMLTYALGRVLLPGDDGYVADISAATQGSPPGLRDILNRVVASDSFTMRHGEP